MEFKHNEETFFKALGLDPQIDVAKKIAPIMQSYSVGNITLSQTAEVLHRTLEPNEVLLLATMQVREMVEKGHGILSSLIKK